MTPTTEAHDLKLHVSLERYSVITWWILIVDDQLRSGGSVLGELVLNVHGVRIRIQSSAALHRDTAVSAVHATFHVLTGGWQIGDSVMDNHHLHNDDTCLSTHVGNIIGLLCLGLTTRQTS